MKRRSDVGFVFSTKDRVHLSLRALSALDRCGGFDVIWVDGSVTPEGRSLPKAIRLKNANLVEIHEGITGGPDAAIQFGLMRLLELGYAHCGLIESDVLLHSGWFAILMDLFEKGRREGLAVGAVTVKTLASRVLYYRKDYAILWSVGASMILFTRKAAKIVLLTYRRTTSREVAAFYQQRFGKRLDGVWELGRDVEDRELGTDWNHMVELYRHGLVSIGSIPARMDKMDSDLFAVARTHFVTEAPDAAMEPFPGGKIPWRNRWMRLLCGDLVPARLFLCCLAMLSNSSGIGSRGAPSKGRP
jgi:hypothetical protein